jgi:hypothetical protein
MSESEKEGRNRESQECFKRADEIDRVLELIISHPAGITSCKWSTDSLYKKWQRCWFSHELQLFSHGRECIGWGSW